MNVVIEISEDEYEWVKRANRQTTPLDRFCVKAIANGTPLPEHHGDLVDRSCICKAIYASEDNLTGSGMTYDEMDIYNDGIDSMWDKLQNATPVIKAERSDNE